MIVSSLKHFILYKATKITKKHWIRKFSKACSMNTVHHAILTRKQAAHHIYRLRGEKKIQGDSRFIICWHVIYPHEVFIWRCSVTVCLCELFNEQCSCTVEELKEKRITTKKSSKQYLYRCFLLAFPFIVPYKTDWLWILVACFYCQVVWNLLSMQWSSFTASFPFNKHLCSFY